MIALVVRFWTVTRDGGLAALAQSGHDTLKLVSASLAFSAGVELAFMLFTPGPDEAIEPVILGFASMSLLVVSETNVGVSEAASAVMLALAIALLFTVRAVFIPQRRK